MNNLDKVKLLMWKYFLFYKYHWIVTTFEIGLPILLVYIVIKISQAVIDTSQIIVHPTVVPWRHLSSVFMYDVVLYTPNDESTWHLIDKAATKLKTVTEKEVIFEPVSDENEMVLLISDSTINVCGVVFLEISNVFRYKIRDKNVYNTSEMFYRVETEEAGPPKSNVYSDTGFIGLMDLLNWCFVTEIVVNLETDYIDLQRTQINNFPYPDYTADRSPSRSLIPLILAFTVVITSLVMCSSVLFIIISEKKNGTKEMMIIAGVQEKLLWLTMFLKFIIKGFIVCTSVTILLKHNFLGKDAAIIQFVYTSVLWVCLMLFFISQMTFCFMFCAIFNSVLLATSSFFVSTIVVSYLALKSHQWHSTFYVHLSCFIPAGAFIQGFIRFSYYELLGSPLPWSSVFTNEIGAADASVGFVLLTLIFDIFLYLFLTYYFSVISPGKFGYQKSLLFFLKKVPKKHIKDDFKKVATEKKNEFKHENYFIEAPVEDSKVSLIFKNLQKNFGYVQAVKNVNLTVYKNEITVLLGHNGAGKTTLLTMIMGLVQPTSGEILFKGVIDLLKNMNEFRKNLGVCPEEDSLFNYMTVIDHLMFFGLLKGATNEEVVEEALLYLKMMDIEMNADDKVAVLSKAMRRKLSLTIALMGKADVLVLDEPTSGLDNLSKQKIWNLLTKLRENRTIIFTSQCMNEASVVGSRIAVMNHGLIVAYGTADFLKKTFGIGYRLTLVKKKNVKVPKDTSSQLADIILKAIPNSKIESRTKNKFVFVLPASETARFPPLIRGIEAKKSVLNVQRLIISSLTLEQLFFKLGGESVYDEKGKLLKPSSVEGMIVPQHLKGKTKGLTRELLQHKALFSKKLIYLFRNGTTFLLRVCLPTILMILLLRGMEQLQEIDPPLELTLKATYPGAVVLLLNNDNTNFEFFKTYLTFIRKMGANPLVVQGTNLEETLLNYAEDNINSYRREVVIARDFSRAPKNDSKSTVNVMCNQWARHSKPVCAVTEDNAKLQYYTQKESYMIIPINHPIKPVNVPMVGDKYHTKITDQLPIITVWFILMAFFTIDLLDYFVIPVKIERSNGFKQIQLLSSLPLRTYWINNFIFDFILFLLIVILRMVLFKVFDHYGFFAFRYDTFIAVVIILLFITSGLLFIYVFSFIFSFVLGSYLFFFFFNLICMLISFTYYMFEISLMEYTQLTVKRVILLIVKYIILLIPPLNFSLTFEKFLMSWRVNNKISAYAQHGLNEMRFHASGDKYLHYLEIASLKNPNGILEELMFLAMDAVIYGGLLCVIEKKIIIKFINSIFYSQEYETESNINIPDDTIKVPDDVTKERDKVNSLVQIKKADSPIKNILIVQRMKKIFENLFQGSLTAVNDVTFTVSMGECFGVLGIAEAGKTTTFKMLTGEILPTKGDAWILNAKLSENKTEYFSRIGYCAETNCFLEELTGKETLNFIASLKGINEKDRQSVVDKWLSILGLEPVENKKCSQYSPGNKRKLCTALALIGNPNVALLDEATSGIDPISRKQIYNIIIQTKFAGQAVALTSHSIEECNTLCDRLTILVKGDMKFIGTTEELKRKYGRGFSLLIKLIETHEESEEIRDEKIQGLKSGISIKFKKDSYVLKEESKKLLRYYLKHTLPLADSFQKMEELKKELEIIEEYFLTEISLEEIFHSLSKDSV